MSKNKKPNTLSIKYVGIAIVILAIIGLSTYRYMEEDNNIPASASVQVQFADGTIKTFDSSTMAMGALYNPQTNSQISSITTNIKIRPVVQASDGSYPTSLTAGYSLTKDDSTGVMKILVNGVDVGLTVPTLIGQGAALTPNTDNVLVSNTLTSAQISAIDASNVPDGGIFQIQYDPVTPYFLEVKLTKPDGTSTVLSPTQIPTISMSIKKVGSTYTLTGVTISGAFT